MGKKKLRSKTASKGERRSTVAGVRLVRESRSELEKALNKVTAWRKGQNPWVLVSGPGSNQLFKRVRANTAWGDPKKLSSTFGREE